MEISALSKIAGVKFSSNSFTDEQISAWENEPPYCVAEFPNDSQVKSLLNRSILLRYACELWGMAKNYVDLYKNLKENLTSHEPYMQEGTSYRIRVQSFGKQITHQYKITRIEEAIGHLPFRGRIDLKNAENTFHIFEYYAPKKNTCLEDDQPIAVCFGRLVGKGQAGLPDDYNIKTRVCIGNTTMDATLSFLMANIAAVKPGSMVCDPFVGTGSLLLPAAHFGAYCVGTEIKYNILHGLGKSSRAFAGYRKPGENLFANFNQYGLTDWLLGACLADASRHELWSRTSIFDAIITDPPYGIREKSTKIGQKPGKAVKELPSKHAEKHYPMQTKYSAGDVFLDLLNFAADYLVKDGRLVYWLPVLYDIYSEDVIPRHPRLRLVGNCEQKLTSKYGRRLIVMEKIRESDDQELDIDEHDGKAYFIRDCYSFIPLREFVMRSGSSEDSNDTVKEIDA